jgi:toxin CcdB
MAFGDLFRNPDTASRAPLLLDVQADLLADLATRILVPLTPATTTDKPSRLTPIFELAEGRYVMLTPQLAGVPRRHIGAKIGSLADKRGDIIAALDMLFTGI